jgi:hypothetical protein
MISWHIEGRLSSVKLTLPGMLDYSWLLSSSHHCLICGPTLYLWIARKVDCTTETLIGAGIDASVGSVGGSGYDALKGII